MRKAPRQRLVGFLSALHHRNGRTFFRRPFGRTTHSRPRRRGTQGEIFFIVGRSFSFAKAGLKPRPTFIHHPPFTIHYPRFTIHHSPFPIHHPQFTIHHSPLPIHHPRSTIHHELSQHKRPGGHNRFPLLPHDTPVNRSAVFA